VAAIDCGSDRISGGLAGYASACGCPECPITNRGVYPNFSNKVTVIDMTTNKVVTTIDVGLAPAGIAVYVANRAVNGTVSVIDTATNAVSATVAIGSKVYVANQARHSTVSVIDTATNALSATIDVGPTPAGVGQTLDTPSVRDCFSSIGEEVTAPERRGPEYLAKFVASEIERWSGQIRASGATMD
jgi:YVTN family beta-propeller protein